MKNLALNSRKKVWIALAALVIALICLAGGIISIYALSDQTNYNFKANFQVDEKIDLKVNAYYQYEGDETKTQFCDLRYEENGSIVGEAKHIGVKYLTESRQAVRFIFEFDNLSVDNIRFFAEWEDLNDTTINDNVNLNISFYDRVSYIPTQFQKSEGMDSFNVINRDGEGIELKSWNATTVVLTFSINDLDRAGLIESDTEGGLTFSFERKTFLA